MTITDETFGMGLMTLEARFGPVVKNQDLAEAESMVKAIYYELLNERLDDESFLKGVYGCVASCQFFPTADQITEAGLGTPRQIALKEWNELVEYRAKRDQALSFPISDAGKYAAKSVGGIRFVCDAMTQRERSGIRRDFLESYALAISLGMSTKAKQVKTMAAAKPEPPPPTVDVEGMARLSKMVQASLHAKNNDSKEEMKPLARQSA